MKTKFVIVGLLFSSLALSGCADPTAFLLMNAVFNKKKDDRPADPARLVCSNGQVKMDNETGIVGGQLLHKDSWLARGVVFILQKTKTERGRIVPTLCTGTLIDSNMVLTAAHCVDDAEKNGVENLTVSFTNQPECDATSGKFASVTRQVSAVRIHANWSTNRKALFNRGDLALVRLSSPAPAGFYPLKLAKDHVPMEGHQEVYLTGYGQTNVDYHGEDNEGILLRLTTAKGLRGETRDRLISGMVENGMMTVSQSGLVDNSSSSEVLFIDQSEGHGICAGDSGGPSLMKNREGDYVVTGVASIVMNPFDGNALCGFVAGHASVSYYRSWLESSFSELRNSDSKKYRLFE